MPPRIIIFVIFVVLYGLLYGEVRISQGDTVSDTKQIEMLIERYGKRRLIEFILEKKSGQITLDVNGKLQTFYGSPNSSYVTPQTILIDLNKVNLSPTDVAKDIDLQESRQKKDEERRQAQVRQEAERLRQQTAGDERKKAQEVAKAEAQVARKKAQEQPQERSPQLHYTVLEDDTTSVPGKVLQELLVAPDITKADLQTLLQARYEEVRRRSFTQQKRLMTVHIYAYPSREHAAGGQNWIGMLVWASGGDRPPTISLRPEVGQAPTAPEERFGFSEAQRKDIFKRLIPTTSL